MQILIGRGSCKITFEDNDKYSGKTLVIKGEGNLDKEFCVYKSHIHEMYWKDSTIKANQFVWVDAEIRDAVLSYVIKEAQKVGYSLLLW